MNERLKMLRKALGLTQQAFASEIGIQRSTVSIWEGGTKTPADRTVKQICQRWSVNENWLRTGDGEMFAPGYRKQQIANFVSDITADNSVFKLRLVNALATMNQDEWDTLEKLVDQLSALGDFTEKLSGEK